MASTKAKRLRHLRLVEPTQLVGAPPIVTDPAVRQEFEHLTQRLVDLAIEITDLADGDPDVESNGDEFEDSDGI